MEAAREVGGEGWGGKAIHKTFQNTRMYVPVKFNMPQGHKVCSGSSVVRARVFTFSLQTKLPSRPGSKAAKCVLIYRLRFLLLFAQ